MKYVGEARAKYNPSAPLIGVTTLPGIEGGVQLRRMFQEAKTHKAEVQDSSPTLKEILNRCTALKAVHGRSFVSGLLRSLRYLGK
jgi:hypothetical protein